MAIGPAIEDGFYYDFELPRALTPEDLKDITERMREIIKGDFAFSKEVVDAKQAREIFKDQPFKLELIRDLEAGEQDEHGDLRHRHRRPHRSGSGSPIAITIVPMR